MKRYGLNEFGQLASESQAGGDYVLFTDAQADKHAALKELAAQALPSVIRDKGSGPGECRCEGCVRRELGLVALIARLQKLTEGPV